MRGFSLSVPAVLLATSFVATLPTSASGQPGFVDAQGREWRQMAGTTNKAWTQFDAICPNDGATPCAGVVGGVDLTGWTWATRAQVLELFSGFVPEIAHAPALAGPEYVLVGLSFFGAFKPTWEYYTTFGGYNYISAWTATQQGGQAFIPEVSAQYPVFHGSWNLQALADPSSTSPYRGAWMFKAPPGPFEYLGGSKPGTYGAPGLVGSGATAAGAPTTLKIQNGMPNGLPLLVIGTSAIHLPAHGTTLVPSPDLVVAGLQLDGQGAMTLTTPWPAGIPSGLPLYFQALIPDPFATQGLASTNALKFVTP